MGVATDAAALTTTEPAPSSGRSYRILHVNSVLTGGGTDEYCVKLVQALRATGQQVKVAAPAASRYHPALAEVGLFTASARPDKPRFILHLARCIRRHQPQIVHAHHGRDYWPTLLAVWFSGHPARIVFSRHLAKSPGSWASRQFLLSLSDAVIAVSEFVARVLRQGVYEPDSPDKERRVRPPMQGDKSKIFVVPGGIDTDQFRPLPGTALRERWKLGPEHFVFAVVGAYDKPRGKGQRDFLLAAAAIHQQSPNARFLIIGRGSLAQTLQEDIARLGLAEKAWLTPYCHDMPEAMNAIDCLVHPAVGTEAFGLVICEAHACGKPIIASDLDGIPEAFAPGGCGKLVPPGDIAALAAAMSEQALVPPLDASQKAAMHRRVAQSFSWRRQADAMLQVYQKLLEHSALEAEAR